MSLLLQFEGVSLEARGPDQRLNEPRLTNQPLRPILKDIDLQIQAGERWMILGPNGAGKTSLVHLGMGLVQPSAGRVIASPSLKRQDMVFQQPIFLRSSVLDNLCLPLNLIGLAKAEQLQKAHACLDRFGLSNFGSRAARQLSGGEQQRLALARSLITDPDLLWLDEPTASLDPAATRQIEALLLQLPQAMATVMVAHDLGQARRLATHVAVLHMGQLLEAGPVAQVMESPDHPLVRRFLAGELLA